MSDQNVSALHQEILQLGFTINDEKSIISTTLNVFMFLALWMGIYTVIFAGTMYAYVTRNVSSRYFVPVTVSVVYLCNLAGLSMQWYITQWQFVENGQDRDTVFIATMNTPPKISTAVYIISLFGLVLGDSLLIWRCFNIWNHSFRVISVPVVLMVTETGELPINLGFYGVRLQNIFNRVLAAGIVIAGCTTILTTALITYRIHSFLEHQEKSRKKFQNIIDIIIQSGALSSISFLMLGVAVILDTNTDGLNVRIYNFYNWTTSFVFPLAGISSTIMIARVATLADESDPTTSIHLTGIQFQSPSATHTGTGTQISVQFPTHKESPRISVREADQVQG
ncbi:hypothetical protein BDN70DRAFT_934500 [Pholiota conissans]|uniref:Uncharacterized protein n=1 Tax=Pholiota conissans TaxID=109636 RepID=A0A9P5YX54_9AGAR|nr:hypothetical protein BDN70DRAFT_934500 [Pholiota conissans]